MKLVSLLLTKFHLHIPFTASLILVQRQSHKSFCGFPESGYLRNMDVERHLFTYFPILAKEVLGPEFWVYVHQPDIFLLSIFSWCFAENPSLFLYGMTHLKLEDFFGGKDSIS